MLVRMRRIRDELDATPGLIAGHLFATTEFIPQTGGLPTLRRWALLCAFEDDATLEAFEDSRPVAALTDRARESWRVTLEPTRLVSGSWRGWCPATDDIERLSRDEPLAVMAYGILRPRYVPRFLRFNRRIVAASMNQDGLVARIGLSDTAMTASTFSIWRSQGDVARFAYGPETEHKPIVRPSKDIPWANDYFFARFRLRDSRGAWSGRDPVAEARADGGSDAAAGNGSGPAEHDALDSGQVAQPAH